MRLIVILTCIWAAVPFSADARDIGERIEDRFLRWAEASGQTEMALIVLRDGQMFTTVSRGMDVDDPVPLASLSKAITGICLQRLADERGIDLRRPLSETLPDATGALALPKARTLVPADVLTHTAGLMPDMTQTWMSAWLDRDGPQHEAAAELALQREAQSGTPGVYAYNNENYAILGLIIEALSGRSYEDTCRDLVLTPAGVTTGSLDLPVGTFGAWGGWTMSAPDFARIVIDAFAPDSALGSDPSQLPHAEISGGAYYGVGTLWRRFQDAHNFWHFGALCFPDGPNAGSYFAYWWGEWSFTAVYDQCIDFDTMIGLDGAMVDAVFGD